MPNITTLEQLKKISEILLDEQSGHGQLLQTCQDFFTLGETLSGIGEQSTEASQATDTILPNGKAVSPLTAARCVREYARTSCFVRGLYEALLEAQQRFPGQTIHALYAGCGPYATLILPLLARLPRDSFRFTLIDIHPLALESAKKIINHFGFEDFIQDYQLLDACTTSLVPFQPFHVAVTETMNQAMYKEPQLAVSANLVRYLEPDGILIPEQITVKAALIDSSREITCFPSDHQGEMIALPRRRLELGTIMLLDKTTLKLLDLNNPATHLPPITLPWPNETVREKMRLGLLTHIKVFGSHCLQCYDTSLTIPKILRINATPDEALEVEFCYRLGESPGFDYRFI